MEWNTLSERRCIHHRYESLCHLVGSFHEVGCKSIADNISHITNIILTIILNIRLIPIITLTIRNIRHHTTPRSHVSQPTAPSATPCEHQRVSISNCTNRISVVVGRRDILGRRDIRVKPERFLARRDIRVKPERFFALCLLGRRDFILE